MIDKCHECDVDRPDDRPIWPFLLVCPKLGKTPMDCHDSNGEKEIRSKCGDFVITVG